MGAKERLEAFEEFHRRDDVVMDVTFTKRDIRELYMLGKIRGPIVEEFDAFTPNKALRYRVVKRDGVIVGERLYLVR